jgi:hypothetical protein
MNRATRMHQSRAQDRTEGTLTGRRSVCLAQESARGDVARRDSRVLREHNERVSASKRGTRCSEAQSRSACSRKPHGVVQRNSSLQAGSEGQRADKGACGCFFAAGQTCATKDDEMRRSGFAEEQPSSNKSFRPSLPQMLEAGCGLCSTGNPAPQQSRAVRATTWFFTPCN